MGANPLLHNKRYQTAELLWWRGAENPVTLFHKALMSLAIPNEQLSVEQQRLLTCIVQYPPLLTWQRGTATNFFLNAVLTHDNQAIIAELLKLSLHELRNTNHRQKRNMLHIAALHGHVDFCRALLTRGVKIDVQDDEGNTALMLAASQGQAAVCQCLLEMGANPTLRNHQGETADSLYAPRQANTISRFHTSLLSLASLQVEDAPMTEQQRLLRGLISQCPYLLTWQTATNSMDFLTAIFTHNNQAIITELAQTPEWPNLIAREDNVRLSLLHIIAAHNYVGLYPYLQHLAINDQNNLLRRTPLQLAALEGNDAFCCLLIEKKADLNRQDSEGHSALMLAAIKGHASTCRLLLKAGVRTDLVNIQNQNAECLWAHHDPHQANPFAIHFRTTYLTAKKAALLSFLPPRSRYFWQDQTPQYLALNALEKNISEAEFKTSDLNVSADDLLLQVFDAWQDQYQYTLNEKILIEFKKIIKPTLDNSENLSERALSEVRLQPGG